MGTSNTEVDLFNPGQVFACLGLAEASLALHGSTSASFQELSSASARFLLETDSVDEPIADVVRFLGEAEVVSIAPPSSYELATAKWKVDTSTLGEGAPFPFPAPQSPATLPARLDARGKSIVIDYWGDATVRDNFKLWAGSGGYPGAGLVRDALDLARPFIAESASDPFSISTAQSSSFRLDWRRDYVPLGVGFSLNNHSKKITPRGYPIIEVLGAIGLTHARPRRTSRSSKLDYTYAVPLVQDIPLSLLRAALGAATLPFPTRTFRITLNWPGQEGQARCITQVVEET